MERTVANPSVTVATRESRPGLSLLRKLSGELRTTPGYTSQQLYNRTVGVPARMERLLEKLVRVGGRDLAHKIVARFQSILESATRPAFTPALVHAEVRADAEQDVSRVLFHQATTDSDPSNDRDAAKAAVRRLDVEIGRKRELRDAIVGHFGL